MIGCAVPLISLLLSGGKDSLGRRFKANYSNTAKVISVEDHVGKKLNSTVPTSLKHGL